MIERDDELPARLREAARHLREVPAPSDLWRHRLLHALAAAPAPMREPGRGRASRVWSVRPAAAVAAAVVFLFVGGAAGVLLGRSQLGGGGSAPPEASAAAFAAISTVRFTLEAPGAARVSLVGDFNDWNPEALPLRRSADGRTWEVQVPLKPGRYAYAFMVDGALARDPRAPQVRDDDFGTPNSILMVSGS